MENFKIIIVEDVPLELKRQGRALSLETSHREHQGSPEGGGGYYTLS